MTSKSFAQGAFLNPEDSPEPSTIGEKSSYYRHPTVYDAVAGRISLAGFIPKHQTVTANRDTISTSTTAIAPETVLFRGKNAPTRYAESDIYFANERQSITDLPESELLKALHCYASDFYSRATPSGGSSDWNSMDETALIALGVLMEEMCLESLGKTGDLAFTEGEEREGAEREIGPGQRLRSKERPMKRRRV